MCANIRMMTVEDLPAVYRLGSICFDASTISYSMWSVVEVAHHLDAEPELCRVSELNGEIVGFVLAAATFDQLTDVGHLAWLAVHPDRRQTRLALDLLEQILVELRHRGKEEVIADVTHDNKLVAQALRRYGFVHVQSIDFFSRKL
jgi:ribosomal protein S18 acetylase RimI-like enzyme